MSKNIIAESAPKKFFDRLITINLPTASILFILAVLEEVAVSTALVSFASALILSIVITLPFFMDLQALANYTKDLTKGNVTTPQNLTLKDSEEAAEIVKAINEMHNIWSSTSQKLEAQTITDAAVLDSLPDPLIMVDKELKITGANLTARDVFGHNIREQQINRIFNNETFLNKLKQVIANHSKEEVEFTIKKPWNKSFIARIKPLPWVSKTGAIAVISFYDLTEFKRVEKMQADFVANASHELKTPLSIISGFIETILGPAKDDLASQKNFFTIIEEQIKRMSLLIENLLSLSKIEQRVNLPLNDKIDLEPLINKTIENLSVKAKDKQINLSWQNQQLLPIKGDEFELKQLLLNLVDNAIKYGADKTELIIKTSVFANQEEDFALVKQPKEILAVEVINYGNPISEKHLSRLSERFYRIDSSSKIKGTGLGLSIAQQIVKHHKALMKITSSEQDGTNFTVLFPLNYEP